MFDNIALNREFYDEKWTKNRVVTSLDWSTQVLYCILLYSCFHFDHLISLLVNPVFHFIISLGAGEIFPHDVIFIGNFLRVKNSREAGTVSSATNLKKCQ